MRAKFDVESTLRSKHQGRPTVPPASRQIGLRCIYCDVEFKTETLLAPPPPRSGSGMPAFMKAAAAASSSSSSSNNNNNSSSKTSTPRLEARSHHQQQAAANPYTEKMVGSGISCPNCKQHLPRCVVCLEVVGMPRSDRPEQSRDPEVRRTARFPTFCASCGHVLHLDHARQWFARHRECPVPECRCLCNTRINDELDYA
jgi:hypothetical protein